jgi:hypothetical protein
LFILQISILNNVQYSLEKLKMQTLFVEKLALTFVGDAYALATGFGKILVKIAMSPVERMAKACDVAGVLSERRAKARFDQFRSSRHAPTSSRRSSPRRCLFPFRSLNHLT